MPKKAPVAEAPKKGAKKAKAKVEDNGKKINTKQLADQMKIRPATLRRYLRTLPAYQDEKYTPYRWDEDDKKLDDIKNGFAKFQSSEKEKNKKRLAELKKKDAKKTPAKKGKAKKAKEEDEEEPEEEESVDEEEETEDEEEEVIE